MAIVEMLLLFVSCISFACARPYRDDAYWYIWQREETLVVFTLNNESLLVVVVILSSLLQISRLFKRVRNWLLSTVSNDQREFWTDHRRLLRMTICLEAIKMSSWTTVQLLIAPFDGVEIYLIHFYLLIDMGSQYSIGGLSHLTVYGFMPIIG